MKTSQHVLETSKLAFTHVLSRWHARDYLMDPAATDGPDLLEERRDLVRRADRLDNWAILPFAAAFVTAIGTLTVMSDATTRPAGWWWLGGAVASIAIFVVTVLRRRALIRRADRNIDEWVDSGKVIALEPLDEFIVNVTDDQVIWDALHLLEDSRDVAAAVKWANAARPDGRLASGAFGPHEKAKRAAHEMRQQAADMLDPQGKLTSNWLLRGARA